MLGIISGQNGGLSRSQVSRAFIGNTKVGRLDSLESVLVICLLMLSKFIPEFETSEVFLQLKGNRSKIQTSPLMFGPMFIVPY